MPPFATYSANIPLKDADAAPTNEAIVDCLVGAIPFGCIAPFPVHEDDATDDPRPAAKREIVGNAARVLS